MFHDYLVLVFWAIGALFILGHIGIVGFFLWKRKKILKDTQKRAAFLQLRKDPHAFGLPKAAWTKALERAESDPVVSIRHAALQGDSNCRIHVASIPEHVGCHVHFEGREDYAIVSGQGVLHWGAVSWSAEGKPAVVWEALVNVTVGDRFTIPQGYAHQLERFGEEPLVILFACPDKHLNSVDRLLLEDSPLLRKNLLEGPPAEKVS